jgi:hypothetical protein
MFKAVIEVPWSVVAIRFVVILAAILLFHFGASAVAVSCVFLLGVVLNRIALRRDQR